MKKIILILLVIIVAVILITSFIYFKKFYKLSKSPSEKIDLDAYKNFLDYALNEVLTKKPEDPKTTFDIVNAYFVLGFEVPRKQEVIDYLNSMQTDDGTWPGFDGLPHGKHFAPHTASSLMALKGMGSDPAKSLDRYFESVNTYDELLAYLDNPRASTTGYWGESWGHITTWIVEKNQSPPWTNQWYQYSKDNFGSLLHKSHQRVHFIASASELCLEIPKKQELIDTILQEQHADGTWYDSSVDEGKDSETANTIQMLDLIGASGSEVEQAKQKGINYLLTTYKEWYQNGKKFASFQRNGKPNPMPNILEALASEGVILGSSIVSQIKLC